jgi:putative endopeptidase
MRILKYSIAALILALPAQLGIYAQISLEKPPARLPGVDLRLIDATADPCVDFTKYACGNFAKIHPIPADESSYGTFDVVTDYVSSSVHAMLEKASKGGTERDENEQKIGDYYAACLDVQTINERGLRSIKTELDRIRTLQRKQDLASLLAHYRLLEVSAFFESRVSQDLKDARKQILVFDQGGLGLPERGYYLREGEKDKRLLQLYEPTSRKH